MAHADRKGRPIEVGTICTFYGWPGTYPSLRVKVTHLRDSGLVDAEVLEILDEDQPEIWRDETTVSPPDRLLEIEEVQG